jgi:hypothetical protein
MAIERTALDSLQQRVDAIRATGNDDLAGKAWHALSQVIRAYYLETTNRDPQHVTAVDLRLYLRRHDRVPTNAVTSRLQRETGVDG